MFPKHECATVLRRTDRFVDDRVLTWLAIRVQSVTAKIPLPRRGIVPVSCFFQASLLFWGV